MKSVKIDLTCSCGASHHGVYPTAISADLASDKWNNAHQKCRDGFDLQDYILDAVHLADGFYLALNAFDYDDNPWGAVYLDDLQQPQLDALAAQLVRQADARFKNLTVSKDIAFFNFLPDNNRRWVNSDRSINIIRAIIDSEALK